MSRCSAWSALGLSVALVSVPALSAAASFGDALKDTIERAAKSEVQRKADQETRRVTRCVLGDAKCARDAEKRGDTVETVPAAGGAAAATGAAAGTAAAADVDPGGDHPMIAPYPGSQRQTRQFDAYTDYRRETGSAKGEPATQVQEGKLTRIRYLNPKGRSTFELMRNYRDALVARGFRVEWACDDRGSCGRRLGSVNGMLLGVGKDVRYFTGVLRQAGGAAYVSMAFTPRYTDLHVLETATMDSGQVVVDANALGAGLDADGKVTLQGIYFDTGRDTLRPESDAALAQVMLLLQQRPALRLRIVGHTDSTGSAEANLALSQARAARVREALLARGVAANRLEAVGMGPNAPVASNDTEDGRARNRRVELVKA
ncbi:OmpA family protein [Rubrivivax albus]|uniref:OmpA family protein n=1 Tax=Rubrivivax albus TaxID=2499835 RepID=A0A3S2UQR7_9BURK|nr:OmpA family protein [Rubrivivax albus]RVT52251.1 OmpA family protein [Rubrivivax albus]